MIVMRLVEGPQRFTELKRAVGGISQRMLTVSLRALERDGFVDRTVTPSIPPRVDYSLTALGESLRVAVSSIGFWALSHQEEVEIARRSFDSREASA